MLLQSGSEVPEWISHLPKASKLRRKQMGKVKRSDLVNPARKIGRADAIKKRFVLIPKSRTNFLSIGWCREMIVGSKRRGERLAAEAEQELSRFE